MANHATNLELCLKSLELLWYFPRWTGVSLKRWVLLSSWYFCFFIRLFAHWHPVVKSNHVLDTLFWSLFLINEYSFSIPRRFRQGKPKTSMQEGIQFVCAQLPSGKKELENSSGCLLKIQKKRIGFLKKQEAVDWEKQREKHVLCHLKTQMTKKNRTFLVILNWYLLFTLA